jgi:hypothetical protein
MNHLEYKRTLTAEQAIEEELILCHLGTLESFESPWEALGALMLWHQDVGEYFAKQEPGFTAAHWRILCREGEQ